MKNDLSENILQHEMAAGYENVEKLRSQYPTGIIRQLMRIERGAVPIVAMDDLFELLLVTFEKKGKIRVWDRNLAICLTAITSCKTTINNGFTIEDMIYACGENSIQFWLMSSLDGKKKNSEAPPEGVWQSNQEITASMTTNNTILVALADMTIVVLSSSLMILSQHKLPSIAPHNENQRISVMHSSDDFVFAAQGSSQDGCSVVHVFSFNGSNLIDTATVNNTECCINGTIHALDTYESHTLVVAADDNVTMWTIADRHPMLNKQWARLHGISKPHQQSFCSSFRIWRGFGISGAEDGTIKLWNFEQNQGALPSVVRVLPGQDDPIRSILTTKTSFIVAGDTGVAEEWNTTAVQSKILKQRLPKSLGGHSLPVSAHIIPTRRYGKVDLKLLLMTTFSAIVGFQQFLSLPFADSEMWATSAEPMTIVLPVTNFQFTISAPLHEVFYWTSAALILMASAIFFLRVVPKLMVTVAHLHSSAKGNWPQLHSKDPEEVRKTELAIVGIKKKAKRTGILITLLWRFVSLITGVGLMPILGKLFEIYSCVEIVLPNNSTADRWSVDNDISCYTPYHKAKMITSCVLGLLLIIIACRLSFIGNDVRLLCRVTFDSSGNPVTGFLQMFTPPISQNDWPFLPAFMLPSMRGVSSYDFALFILRVVGGVLSAYSLNRGFVAAKIQSWCVAATLLSLMSLPIFIHPYHSKDLLKYVFAFNSVSAFAGCCGVLAVTTSIKAVEEGTEFSKIPTIVWYAGIVPVFLGSVFIYPKLHIRQ